jgi:hypothetical protein
MPGVFHWRVPLPGSKTFAKRAEECRWLSSVISQEFREGYLKLAVQYEQLAEERRKSREPCISSGLPTKRNRLSRFNPGPSPLIRSSRPNADRVNVRPGPD